MTYGAARGQLQGSLCTLLLVLLCIVALLTDLSGSIFAYLRIIADSDEFNMQLTSMLYVISCAASKSTQFEGSVVNVNILM